MAQDVFEAALPSVVGIVVSVERNREALRLQASEKAPTRGRSPFCR